MAIYVALHHVSEYEYDRLVGLGPQLVRLRPAPHCRTPIRSYALRVHPGDHFLNWQQDPHGNWLARLVFPKKTRQFRVEVDLVAEMVVVNPFDFFLEASAEHFPFEYDEWLSQELAPFRKLGPDTPLLQEFVASIDLTRQQTTDFLVALNQIVHHEVAYLIRMEHGVQTPEETLEKGSGSCRDSAWLMVQVLRRLGFAARFVSGYLLQLTADVKPLDGPAGPAVDFTDLHAWTEVYLPGAGWVGLDPTSGLFAGEGHIPLAATPDPQSAAPIAGPLDKCESEFRFEMKVTRIHEDPRVTKPYTDEDWIEITNLGRRIDEDLKRMDVRLTMGGEPTFVSIDNMDGAEWNTAANGREKRRLAGQLFRRMRDRFAPGGLMHYGQGKWYPGESLPRWALTCFWRRDGEPIWRNPALVADESRDYGATEHEARKFIEELAARLGVQPRHALPAYEDIWYYLWKERKLPINVDPLDSRLDDEEERRRLARVFERGLSRIAGYALPLSKGLMGWDRDWMSGAWFLRQERMYLLAGDSPMGLRLPLDSLPYATEAGRPWLAPDDPTVNRPALPRHEQLHHRFGTDRPAEVRRMPLSEQRLPDGPNGEGPPARGQSGDWILRTALCAEAREGRLHLFLPPVRRLEDYLEMITAVEATAESQEIPVTIEGYAPPHDPRVNHFRITPDPGVIEVNIHPAHNWDDLVETTTELYDMARLSRLGTEKFMLDGRHTGTGGGNHIVVGGATPHDSPFLRRPDLLRSLISYWHNHPALSYLFSGLFVGPTSQAPRVDEARNDSIYELETAFALIPEDSPVSPWLVDRIFRNLLVDVTGNTHRAEFCIDKLYSPDTPTGRLGLLELRAFEMPPHARMSLAQQLLLRGLIARFWREPYQAPLERWGTSLHDRWMLPHFIWRDFEDIAGATARTGYEIKPEWFAPHFEFRFPTIGEFAERDVQVHLRNAIEPWHVMGEEPAGGAAARYVDSSVERIEIKVRGMTETRHMITCNGRRVPLHPTGTAGEYVAGVRFRAWQPPHCLHPTIGVHTPLVIDLVDGWNGRSLRGCTYHVAHPGGRTYETFPVNAFEAEARRAARFFVMGHTPGALDPPREERNPEHPLTLDLRRPLREP